MGRHDGQPAAVEPAVVVEAVEVVDPIVVESVVVEGVVGNEIYSYAPSSFRNAKHTIAPSTK